MAKKDELNISLNFEVIDGKHYFVLCFDDEERQLEIDDYDLVRLYKILVETQPVKEFRGL